MSEALAPKQLAEEGQADYKRGEYLAAARAFEAASQSLASSGDTLEAAEMLNNTSVAYLQARDPQAALKAVKGTSATFSEMGDMTRQGMALGNLGSALDAVGRLDDAADAYRQSADLLKQVGEQELRATVLQSLSSLQLRTGRQFEALATMKAGLDGIEHPKPKQRIIKSLLQVPFKFLNKS